MTTTFRELFIKISKMEEMRIYEPNRDCMIWETWKKIHAPYNLIRREDGYIDWDFKILNRDYFDNNEQIRTFHTDDQMDEQTKLFLEKFADYEVHGIETGAYYNREFEDPSSIECKPCLDVFICVPDPDHTRECERCFHSKVVDDTTVYRGWSCVPDPDDAECKKCWRSNKTSEEENK